MDTKSRLGRYFRSYKVSERPNRREAGTIQLVICDGDAEALFQRRNDRNDGHGIELGNGTQKGSIPRHRHSPPVKAENFVEDSQNFPLHVQWFFPFLKTRNYKDSGAGSKVTRCTNDAHRHLFISARDQSRRSG